MRFKYYLRGIGLGIIFAVLIMIIAIHNHKDSFLSDKEIIEKAKELGMVMSDNNSENISGTELKFGSESSTTEIYKVDTETAKAPSESASSKKNDKTISKDSESEDAQSDGTSTNKNLTDKTTEDKNSTDKAADKTTEDKNSTDKTTDKASEDKNSTDKTTDKASEDKNSTDKTSKKSSENKDAKNNNSQTNDYVIIKVKQGDVCRTISEALQNLGLVDDAEDFRKYMGKKGYADRIHAGEYKIPRNSTYEEIAQILIKK